MSDYPTPDQRRRVYDRCHGRCEALVEIAASPVDHRGMVLQRPIWTRCFDIGVEIHHALLRSRGGTILDQHGEIYHLIALCHRHHHTAHMGVSDAVAGGLIIPGYVTTLDSGWPAYLGTDEYLKAAYPHPSMTMEVVTND